MHFSLCVCVCILCGFWRKHALGSSLALMKCENGYAQKERNGKNHARDQVEWEILNEQTINYEHACIKRKKRANPYTGNIITLYSTLVLTSLNSFWIDSINTHNRNCSQILAFCWMPFRRICYWLLQLFTFVLLKWRTFRRISINVKSHISYAIFSKRFHHHHHECQLLSWIEY